MTTVSAPVATFAESDTDTPAWDVATDMRSAALDVTKAYSPLTPHDPTAQRVRLTRIACASELTFHSLTRPYVPVWSAHQMTSTPAFAACCVCQAIEPGRSDPP